MIDKSDIVYVEISKEELNICIDNAKKISFSIDDRKDLHDRDILERFNNVLMGEVAEQMVIKWLKNNGKFAESTVNKGSSSPDKGHDVLVRGLNGRNVFCSVKSSLSALYDTQKIIEKFKLATKKSELSDINIQVYFWLTISPKDRNSNRITVPSITQSAIIGWFGKRDIDSFTTYNHENREVPNSILQNARSMQSLLRMIE